MKFAPLVVAAAALLLGLVALAAAPVQANVPVPYYDCTVPGGEVQIQSVSAGEWPPVSGTSFPLIISATLDENVDDTGYLLVGISIGGFPIVPTQNISFAQLPNVTWPIEKGPIDLTVPISVPAIGSITLTVNASAYDGQKNQLLCIGVVIPVVPSVEEADSKAVQTSEIAPRVTRPRKVLHDEDGLFARRQKHAVQRSHSTPKESILPPRELKGALKSFLPRAQKAAEDLWAKMFSSSPENSEVAAVDLAVPVPYSLCNTTSDLISIQSIQSTIWPPVAGSSANITVATTVLQQVNSGTYTGVLSIDGIPLFSTSGSLANVTSMPLLKGPLQLTQAVTLPASLPFSGTVGLKISAKDDNSAAELFCVQVQFQI